MLKKIVVADLQLGMYIERVCGSWLASPFWQKSILLEASGDLLKIQASTIREVWIDTSKGREPAPAVVVGEPVGDAAGGAAILPAATTAEPSAAPPPPPVRLDEIGAVGMAEELARAAKLITKSREAVRSMFDEARMGKAVSMADALPLVDEISVSVMRNAGAMIGLARLKTADDYTYMHSVAVCALMIALGRQLRLGDEEIRQCGMAGLLHDIGKMAIPSGILKKTGKLTDEEFASVKQHPAAGHVMLLATPGINDIALQVCLHHHEKMDGSGYPLGLKGDEISLHARMGAVCDVYDAITSDRPYKRGWCPAESLRRMSEWSKGHFDPVVFAAFVKCIGIYPVGTLVRLESERLGVVVEQPVGESLVRPKVRVFYSAKARAYIKPELIDLAAPSVRDSIAAREDAATWGLRDIERYWNGAIAFG